METGSAEALLAAISAPQTAYPASKVGVIAFVGQQAAAFGALGARITSIAPGFIDTSMGRAEMEQSELMVQMIAKTPLGRLGTGDEIASVADGGILGRLASE